METAQRQRAGLKQRTSEQKGSAEEERPEFHFNPITPEDWRANEAPLADLYQRGIVSAEYVRDRLNIPAEAGKGTMAPPVQKPPTIPSDILPGSREKWRLRMGNGPIVEAEKVYRDED